jgi:hypothetical protein
MLVTSAAEVFVPSGTDDILMLLYQFTYSGQILFRKTVIAGELDLRFHPEIGFPIRSVDVEVHPPLLARKN